MSFQQAARNYKKNAILTAPPEKLVVMLYEGAIQRLEKVRQQLDKGETAPSAPEIGQALTRAMSIISELRASLDMEKGGEISASLDRLYEFCTDRILRANMERKPGLVEETLTILRTLKEGWDGILMQRV